MSWIRDDEEACLVELHAQGAELLERYSELLEDRVLPDALADALRQVVAERERCLDQLAERIRARDALPSAGDPDRAFVQALADALGAETSGLIDRLDVAEAQWQQTLTQNVDSQGDSGWEQADRRVLDRIADHIAETRARLKRI